MKYGYLSCFELNESLGHQLDKLKSIGCTEIYIEKLDNSKSLYLNNLLSILRKGDSFCLFQLDALCYPIHRLLTLLLKFKEQGITFVSIDENIDTSHPADNLITLSQGLLSMKKAYHKVEIIQGLKKAVSQGRVGGRPKSLTEEKLKRLHELKGTMSVTQLCQQLKISRSVYYRELKG